MEELEKVGENINIRETQYIICDIATEIAVYLNLKW